MSFLQGLVDEQALDVRIAAWNDRLAELNKSPSTRREYTRSVRHAILSGRPLAAVLDTKKALKTRHTYRSALKSWAAFIGDEALGATLREIRLSSPKRKTPRIPLAYKKWQRLREAIDQLEDPAQRAVLGLIARRGFRVGDVLRMTWEQVREAREMGILVFVAKGDKYLSYRAKPFMPYLDQLAGLKVRGPRGLESWKEVADLISPRAKPSTRQRSAVARVEDVLKHLAMETIGERVYPHRLRRTYATMFLQKLQGDPEALMTLKSHMQWEDVATAAEYVDHARNDKAAAIEDRMFEDDE